MIYKELKRTFLLPFAIIFGIILTIIYRHKKRVKGLKGKVFLFCLIIIFAGTAHAKVEQDGGGTWQIDTFHNADGYPHLLMVSSLTIREGFIHHQSGQVDTLNCAEVIRAYIELATEENRKLLVKIAALLDYNFDAISVARSCCHREWYVVYIRINGDWAGKEVYEKIWKAINI